MTEKMKAAAEGILQNTLLVLAARTITLVGMPVLMAWIFWATGAVADLSRRMSVAESERVSGREMINERLGRLESSDIRDRQAMADMAATLSGVVATNQAILREVETMRREAIIREQRSRQ